jgi:hypothetical protein
MHELNVLDRDGKTSEATDELSPRFVFATSLNDEICGVDVNTQRPSSTSAASTGT